MKLSCPRKEFFDAVNLATLATSPRSPMNILQNLKITTTDQTVRILGCDGEMWVERIVPAMVEEQGEICVQASLLKELVSSLPDGDVELRTIDAQGVMLSQGDSEYRMMSVDATDYPEPPDYGGEGELTIPMGELRPAIDSVIYAVSTETHRQVLTGVLFSYDGSFLTLVATDTHRLAVRRLSKAGLGSNIAAIVPEKALKAIKSMPISDDVDVNLRFGVGRLGVDTGSARMVTQLLSGTYPNWERVVPSETTREWSIEVDQLSQKVRRALILAKDNANRLEFKGGDNKVVIVAKSDERGQAKEEVDVVTDNGSIDIAFNGKYVQDALTAMAGPGVRVQMTENLRPAIFRPADDEQGYFCVIMPMSMN